MFSVFFIISLKKKKLGKKRGDCLFKCHMCTVCHVLSRVSFQINSFYAILLVCNLYCKVSRPVVLDHTALIPPLVGLLEVMRGKGK